MGDTIFCDDGENLTRGIFRCKRCGTYFRPQSAPKWKNWSGVGIECFCDIKHFIHSRSGCSVTSEKITGLEAALVKNSGAKIYEVLGEPW